jgi:MtN3 and saliva related transmembrane protein
MQIDAAEGLGLVAGAIGSFAFLPQAWKILRDKSAKDVSMTSYVMVLAGAILWFGYGFLREAVSIMLWNLVAGSIAAAVVVLKFRTR